MSGDTTLWPAWTRDVLATLSATPQYVIWGNIHDQHLTTMADGSLRPATTAETLRRALASRGFDFLLHYDPVDGLGFMAGSEDQSAEVAKLLGLNVPNASGDPSATRVTLTQLGDVARKVVSSESHRTALLLSRPTRTIANIASPSSEEIALFALLEKLALTAPARQVKDGVRLYNPIFWVVDRQQDLPPWLIADNREVVRTIVIPLPDRANREAFIGLLIDGMPGIATASPEQRAHAVDQVTDGCDGLSLRDMNAVLAVARDQQVDLSELDDAVRAYRVGASDNPWRKTYLRDALRQAEAEGALSERVLGQPAAVTKALDVLKRSVLGLSGAQARSSGRRPRGVLLFVGPTGVGKTELAKAVTELVFGEGAQPIRFDMSEFRADHSEARLFGAPPGYVGHDAGGELTNAIRRRPFSLVLFDEIDKAHPRILDKFLQVIDEGRLTDGQGATVSFAEAILVFTSNAGMEGVTSKVRAEGGGQDSLPSYEELNRTLRAALEEYFVGVLERPELLNRFGDNIVVFDFARPEVQEAIFELQVSFVLQRVREELGIEIDLAVLARQELLAACVNDPLMGGRGIGNHIESYLLNPLSRALFALEPPRGSRVSIETWALEDTEAVVRLSMDD